MKRLDTSKVASELRAIPQWAGLPDDSQIACYIVPKADVHRNNLRGVGASMRYVAYANCSRIRGWERTKAYFSLPDTVRYLIVLDEEFVTRAMSLGDKDATKTVLRNVIVHEYGHLLQFSRGWRGGHTPEFHYFMRAANVPELRYCGKSYEQIAPSCPMTWGEFFKDYDQD